MSALAQAEPPAVEAAWAALPAKPSYRLLRAPETGLVMVQGRAGGTGAPFNLGEMTVTRCSVELPDGTVGHAYVAGRDARHAETAAVLDALLQELDGRAALARYTTMLRQLPRAARQDRQAPAPGVRVGDADRDAAAAALGEHFAQGRLTLDELNARLDATLTATTHGELSQVAQDLSDLIAFLMTES